MTKKEYLAKIENLIINRVKYHSPVIDTDNINYSLLEAIGIDATYPIFIFKKPLDKVLYQAFFAVKKKIDFNLILLAKPLVSETKILKLNRTFLFLEEEMGLGLLNSLEALNINYLSHSSFEKKLEGEFVKINGKKVEFEYIPYYNHKKFIDNGIVFEIKNFLLNGKNYLINIVNTRNEPVAFDFEVNVPLPRGYYFFKKEKNCIEIENLTNKKKAYFNFNFKKGNVMFSAMEGIESCTFACINFKGKIDLLPRQTMKLYYNFGDKKYCLFSPKEMAYFFNLSQSKMNEIFDMKIVSRDKQFDEKFNLSLPRKIWEKWQNFDFCEKSENEWINLRQSLLIKSEKGIQINQKNKDLKEVKFFRNNMWKRVFILHNDSCYMFVDKVKYFNYTLLTKEIFNKNNEIYLSFAD